MLVVVEQLLNGLQFGLLLFLLAAGLTLVFGIMTSGECREPRHVIMIERGRTVWSGTSEQLLA